MSTYAIQVIELQIHIRYQQKDYTMRFVPGRVYLQFIDRQVLERKSRVRFYALKSRKKCVFFYPVSLPEEFIGVAVDLVVGRRTGICAVNEVSIKNFG